MSFDYPDGVRFRCIRCGVCCGDTEVKTRRILLLSEEAERIGVATAQSIVKFAVKVEGKEPYSYEMKKKEGKCVFFENCGCRIYSVRPLICRFYPFELKCVADGRYTFLYTSECKGINKGAVLSKNYFKKLFRLARLRMGKQQ
ncbi:MAG: YkgJ family cysteine cluster protein [Candidatus Bathyarchaeales archaeon]